MPAVGNELSHVFDGATVRGGLAIVGDAGSTVYLNRDTASATAREQVLRRAHGYYAENFPFRSCSASTITITGTIYYQSIGLLAGDVVSNILVNVATLGSGFSGINAKVGLYSATSATAGTLLASSGDVSASLGSTGSKSLALSTPYTVTADGAYYVAFLNIATTATTLLRAGNGIQSVIGSLTTQGTQSGQTDLVASATVATTSNLGIWVGIS